MGAQSQLVSEIVTQWRSGQRPDARAFIDTHPSITRNKSMVLDLAYEEFCLRREAGETVDVRAFCSRFSTYRRSLQRLIDVHEYLAANPEFGPAPADIEWPAPGELFLGFSIEKELGRGAFARVYRARQETLGNRVVAVKLAWQGASEAMTMGRLSHPGVVPVYSADADDLSGLTVVCMPYLGEHTLDDLVQAVFGGRDDAVPEGDLLLSEYRRLAADEPAAYAQRVASIMLQLADALRYTHGEGVLHRDIKPSNVLLAPDGRPMLLDFNLSSDEELDGPRLGGTLPYMSPEQIAAVFRCNDPKEHGSSSRQAAEAGWDDGATPSHRIHPAHEVGAGFEAPAIDHRSDIYSLGVVVYELLTGRLPLGDVNAREISRKQAAALLDRQKRGPAPLRELAAGVDHALARIVESCLQFEPEARPQSAAALHEELLRYFGRWRRMRRGLQQHPRRLALASAVLVAAIASTSYWLSTRPPFPVRAFGQGMAQMDAGQFVQAANAFTAAIEAGDATAELLFARGMAKLNDGDVVAALSDFHGARKLETNGKIFAIIAYSAGLRNEMLTSHAYGKDAVERGFATAAVWNNLGVACLSLARLEESMQALDRAVALDPTMFQAYQNRARVCLQLDQDQPGLLGQAIADIERALALAPQEPMVWRDAAVVFAYSARSNPGDAPRVQECLGQAVRLGCSSNQIGRSFFAEQTNHPWFQQLMREAQGNPPGPATPPLAIPIASARLK